MEYIQTVLFQIPASRMEQAAEPGGLLAELDAHRDFLKNQSGFRDMRITRSINNEGNVLIVVETRWTDDGSLVRYETNEPNAGSIVRGYQRNLLVPDTLQVLDMEALRTESSWAPAEQAEAARERVVLPIVIPLAVLAFSLLVIYGLSRVYLEISGEGATALAAGLAIGVLLVAFYFAMNPRAPAWQIGAVITVVTIALAGGTAWALIEEDKSEAEGGQVEEPTASAAPGESPGGGDLLIDLGDNYFEFNGEREPAIPVTVGEEVTFTLMNVGAITHNMHVDGTDGEYAELICTPGGDSTACSDPNQIRSGAEATITISIAEAGTYEFRCDFHPVEMTGTIEVQ